MKKDTTQILEAVADCATTIRKELSDIITSYNGQVHFRPTSSGITMIGLLPDRPQRGKGGYRTAKLKDNFAEEFRKHCVDTSHGRSTPEKELQSFIISQAYKHNRNLVFLNSNSNSNDNSDALLFVTDELVIVTKSGKIVCDLLALRKTDKNTIPVIIELKSKREMTRLTEQLNNFESCIIKYQAYFESIFSAVFGENIHFTSPPEKWLVWSGKCSGPDRREAKLAESKIGVIQYQLVDKEYEFYIGAKP